MPAAPHNCSNQTNSGAGSRGPAKWNKQMATKEKAKGKYPLGLQLKAPTHIFADQIKLLKLLTFAAISLTMFSGLFFLSLSVLE